MRVQVDRHAVNVNCTHNLQSDYADWFVTYSFKEIFYYNNIKILKHQCERIKHQHFANVLGFLSFEAVISSMVSQQKFSTQVPSLRMGEKWK